MPDPTNPAQDSPNPDNPTTPTTPTPDQISTQADGTTALGAKPNDPPPADPTATAADEGKQEPKGAPEKYDLKLPDGVTVDEAQFKTFEPIFRKHNLSNEAVQEIAELYASQKKADAETMATSLKTQTDAWGQELAAHPTLGGKNLPESTRVALSAVHRFAPKGLQELLNGTGLGNHPLFVELFHSIGKAIAEDGTFATGRSKGAGAKEDKPFYNGMNP